MGRRKSSSSTLFSSLPYELYQHILSFAVDRELLDPSFRNQYIRTIAIFQSLNRRICGRTEMKEMQIYFNEFWWKVYERNFGLDPFEQTALKMKDEMINKRELKRKIILANYIKFKHSKFNPNGCKEELKTVVLGGGGVGKTALTVYFVQNIFVEQYDPTIDDSYRQEIMVDNIPALVDVYDAAGPEEYSAMRDQYLRYGNAFLMVCSVTDRSSIEDLQYHVEQLIRTRDQEVNDMPVVFAINKTDLLSDSNTREQTLKEYREGIKHIIGTTSLANCSIVETSAKMGENVTLLFEELVRRYRYGTMDNLELLKKVIDLDSSYIKECKKVKNDDRKKCSLM